MNTPMKLLMVTSLGFARVLPMYERQARITAFGVEMGPVVATAVVGPLDDVVLRLRSGGSVRVEVWSSRMPRHLLTVPEGDALAAVETIADPDNILTGDVGVVVS